MRQLLVALEGKVFTLATLNQPVDYTEIARFASTRATRLTNAHNRAAGGTRLAIPSEPQPLIQRSPTKLYVFVPPSSR